MATGKIKVNFKMPTPSAADRMYAKHQAIRKAAGLPDVDNNPDRPDAGKYSSGQSKPVKRVTPIATPNVNEENITVVKKGSNIKKKISDVSYNVFKKSGYVKEDVLDEAKKMEYDQKKVNHLKYVVGILEKEKKEFSRLKDSKEVIDVIDKAINMFAKEYTKHLNALSAGRGQDTNFRVIEEVEQIDEYNSTSGSYKHKGSYGYQGKGKEHGESDSGIDRDYNKEKSREIYTVGSKLNNTRTTELEKGMDVTWGRKSLGKAQSKKTLMNVHKNLPEEVEQLDEISPQLKASYVAGAKKQIKQSEPYTKKGQEYRDIAKNFIAKRERGIAKVTESADDDPKADQMTTDDTKFPKKSRKAQIVKSAAKKLPPEDQFQAKPVLDSQVAQQTNK